MNLPFGNQIQNESTNTTNKRKFTSYDRSSLTGLDYAQNRTYDSKQGRFTQVDPIGMSSVSLMNPQTLNLYAYCGNDPINHTDPDGLFFHWLWKTIKNFFIKVIHAAVKAAIQALPVLFSGGPHAFLAAFAVAFVANLGFPKVGNYLTPGWNPEASHPLSRGGSSGGLNSSMVIRNFIGISQGISPSGIFNYVSPIANFFSDKITKLAKSIALSKAPTGSPCADSIARLINELDSFAGKAASNNLEVIAKRVKKVQLTNELVPLKGESSGDYALSSRIIRIGRAGKPGTMGKIRLGDAETLANANFATRMIHELVHHAKASGTYSDEEMAIAVSRILGSNAPPLPVRTGNPAIDDENFGTYVQKNYIQNEISGCK